MCAKSLNKDSRIQKKRVGSSDSGLLLLSPLAITVGKSRDIGIRSSLIERLRDYQIEHSATKYGLMRVRMSPGQSKEVLNSESPGESAERCREAERTALRVHSKN